MLLTSAAPADTSTVFRLAVQEQGEEIATGAGVLMGNELLLSNYALIAQGNMYVVRDAATDAQLVATVQAVNGDSSLALLSVPGLGGAPATVSMEEPEPGRRVHLLLPEGTQREGLFHSVLEGPDGQARYRFTPAPGENERASPLMNNCGELLAISTRSSGNPFVREVDFGMSGTLPELKRFLNAHNVDFRVAGELCLSLQERLRQAEETEQKLQQERQRLEEEKTALEDELEQIEVVSNEEQQQSQEQMQALQARRDSLDERLRAQNEELSDRERALTEQAQLQQDLEEQLEQQESESTRHQTLLRYIGIGVGILLLIVLALFLLWMRARKRKMQESERELAAAKNELERGKATFPDVVFISEGPEEQEVRIKIDGNALARSESGQIIGRSAADANYVIGIDRISRRHARLRAENDIMTIEDLNSLNGTGLDGVALQPGDVHAVRDGATLTLGDINFTVHILQ